MTNLTVKPQSRNEDGDKRNRDGNTKNSLNVSNNN